jgi:hypothetical protein
MDEKALEDAARAVLHRRIKPDFSEVKDGAWTIDHDKVVAEAAVSAYLDAMTAPAEMPGEKEIARLLFEFATCSDLAKGPAALDTNAHSFAKAILDLFAPILAEKEGKIERVFAIRDRALDDRDAARREMDKYAMRAIAAESRALAAEAALAAEREDSLERYFEWYDVSDLTPCGLATRCHRLGYDFDQIHHLLVHIKLPPNLYSDYHSTWHAEIKRLIRETAYFAKQPAYLKGACNVADMAGRPAPMGAVSSCSVTITAEALRQWNSYVGYGAGSIPDVAANTIESLEDALAAAIRAQGE